MLHEASASLIAAACTGHGCAHEVTKIDNCTPKLSHTYGQRFRSCQ